MQDASDATKKNAVGERRPIRSRNTRWAKCTAAWLSDRGVAPNAVSVAGVVCAALAGLCFALAPREGCRWLWLGGAALTQLRLVCNLLDGMIAVEGGRRTPSGAVFNELPDRLADPLILLGLGYGLSAWDWGPQLGWAAALAAVLTAYVRVLGGSCGLPQDFSGPMAKQHRMAVVTVGAVVSVFLTTFGGQVCGVAVLGLVIVGCAATVIRRTRALVAALEAGGNHDRDA